MKLSTRQPLFPYASRRLRFIQTGVVFSVSIFVSGASGARWGWKYVQEHLAPQISRELSHSFNRPIRIGAVESVSLNSIQFGESSVPATQVDQDTVTIEAVEVQFNPMEFVRQQHLNLDITLHDPVVWIDEQSEGWIDIELTATGDEDMDVRKVRFKNATVQVVPHLQSIAHNGVDIPTELQFEGVNGHFSLNKETQQVVFEMEGKAVGGGELSLSAVSSSDESVAVHVHANQMAIAPFAMFFPSDIEVQEGRVSSDLKMELHPGQEWQGEGTFEFENVDMRVIGEPNPFHDLSVQVELRDRQLHLYQGAVQFGDIPFHHIEGVVDLERGLDLTAEVEFVSVDAFMKTFQLDIPVPVEGALASPQIAISGPFEQVVFSGRVHNAQPLVLDRVPVPKAQTDFSFNRTTDHLILSNLQLAPKAGGQLTLDADIHLGDEEEGENDIFAVDARLAHVSLEPLLQPYGISLPDMHLGQLYAQAHLEVVDNQPTLEMDWKIDQGNYPAQGRVVTDENELRLVDTRIQLGEGQVNVEGAIANGNWQAQLQGRDISLQSLGIELPGRVEGDVDLGGELAGFDLDTVWGDGQARLSFAEGHVEAIVAIAHGNWQASAKSTQVPLHLFKDFLPGQVQGSVTLAGPLEQLSPQAIAADGQFQLVDVLTIQQEPLAASLRWRGDHLEIADAGNSALNLDGSIAVGFDDGWQPTWGEIDLDMSARNLALEEIHIVPLAELDLQGLLTASGTVRGTLDRPELVAAVNLQKFAVQRVAFDPLLQGSVRYTPTQMDVELGGDRDYIAIQSTAAEQSTKFLLKRDRATIEGSLLENGQLNATIDALPLAALNEWVNLSSLPAMQGDLTATVVAELESDRSRAQATFEIQQPAIGGLNPAPHLNPMKDRFVGTLLYADDIVQLSNGQLYLGNSTFTLNGQADLSTSLSGSLHVAIAQGYLQDFITVFPFLPNGTTGETSSSELAPFSALNLPPLNEIEGEWSGELWLARSHQGELSAQMSFIGERWTWGTYSLQSVQIPPTRLTAQQQIVLPIYLSGLTHAGATASPLDTQLTVSGQWNTNATLGQVQLDPIPLSFVANLLDLPVDVDGEVGAIATLSGFPAQTEVVGEVELVNAQVHDLTIPRAKIGFSYRDSVFMLEHWEPLQAEMSDQP